MRYLATMALVATLVAGQVGAMDPAAARQQRLDEIRAMVEAGDYTEAVAAARPFALYVKDKDAKREATRLLAESLRKAGEWAPAAEAYKELAGQCVEGSDDAIRAEATAEVLQASSEGVYPGLKKPLAEEQGELRPRTLDDDQVLAEALALAGAKRAEALAPKVAALKSAKTPPEVASVFETIVVAYVQARVLSPEMSYEAEREAATTAGERLEALSSEAKPKLEEKIAELTKTIVARGGADSALKPEIDKYGELCKSAASAEEAFGDLTKKIGGDRWPGRVKLLRESIQRRREYVTLATRFQRVSLLGQGRRGWGG